MSRLDGKVAFITGAARGQGRSHAVRFAEEGAAIVAMDICAQIPTIGYPMATPGDLEETERLVTNAGGSIVTSIGDVRIRDDVQRAYDAGIAAFGQVDIVVPNAGIVAGLPPGNRDDQAWHDSLAVMLTGVWHTLEVTVPRLVERGEGGVILIISSSAGLNSLGVDTSPGQAGYTAAKHGIVGLMRLYADQLAPHLIRVNTVHPTGVNTPMVVNDQYEKYLADNPDRAGSRRYSNALPVQLIEPIDVSNALVYLASDEGRYVTGVAFPVDAGQNNQ